MIKLAKRVKHTMQQGSKKVRVSFLSSTALINLFVIELNMLEFNESFCNCVAFFGFSVCVCL